MTLIVFFGFMAFLILRLVWMSLKESDYFKVTDIWYEASLKSIESSELAGLKGRNLLTLDLKKIERQLQQRYPQYRQLAVLRRFPNQILVVAKRRAFFAQANINNRLMIIDEKGTMVGTDKDSDDALPYISGISAVKGRLQIGVAVEGYQLQVALGIIRVFQSDKNLSSYRIAKMDISNLSEINIYLDNGLKVIADQENYPEKIRMLGFLLSKLSPQEEMKYVDLRFKEPILGKK